MLLCSSATPTAGSSSWSGTATHRRLVLGLGYSQRGMRPQGRRRSTFREHYVSTHRDPPANIGHAGLLILSPRLAKVLQSGIVAAAPDRLRMSRGHQKGIKLLRLRRF